MTNDYKELIEYLGGKFDRVDEKFEHVDKRFEHIDERFENITERFDNIDTKFRHIDEQFTDIRTDFSNLQIAVDGYAKKADMYFQEMLVLARRVDRMEKWVKEIADKVGVKLEF